MRFPKLSLLVSALLGSGSAAAQKSAPARVTAPLTAAPDLLSDMEHEGWYDLLFFVQAHHLNPDGSQMLELVAKSKSKPVGFTVLLSSQWKAGSLGKEVPLVIYQGTVTFNSSGVNSDELFQCMKHLYKTKSKKKRMKQAVEFSAITLGGNPQKLSEGEVRIKLFFESNNPDNSAELFLNIDLAKRRAHLDEKDEDYREPIIGALGAK